MTHPHPHFLPIESIESLLVFANRLLREATKTIIFLLNFLANLFRFFKEEDNEVKVGFLECKQILRMSCMYSVLGTGGLKVLIL